MFDVFTLETVPKGVLPSFFGLRHDVVNNRLGWDLPVEDGREHDKFDNSDVTMADLMSIRSKAGIAGPILPDDATEAVVGRPAEAA